MAKKIHQKPIPKSAPVQKISTQKTGQTKQKFSFALEIPSLPGLTPYIPGILLFVASLVIALLVYKDYGISYDEPIQRDIGQVTYNYVFNNDNFLKSYQFRGLGTGFELPLIFIEKWLHLHNTNDIYFARHLATHIFFLVAVFCGYVLAYRLFKNKWIASLAFILLAFHPRIYAHSYFNTKDIPFLSAVLISLLISQLAFEKNKPSWYLLLGIACGYATSIRAMGILFFPYISLFFLIDIFSSVASKEKTFPVIRNLLIFIAGFCGMLYLSWPILWSNPFFYFFESFHDLAHIVWNGQVLFNGQKYRGNMLPWNYMPVWFSITVPEIWLVAGFTGFVWVIVSVIKKPVKYFTNTLERNYLLYLDCFGGPVIAMTTLHGVNIDDWRHLYFIYPSFVMLILFAVNKLATEKRRLLVASLCCLQICYTGFFMIRYHPFQQVYFNNLVSHDDEYLRKNYDLEYWGCGFKQGLDYLVAADPAKTIRVNCEDKTIFDNNMLLQQDDNNRRVQFSGVENADYFITNFRSHPHDYLENKIEYSISVLNSTILCVFKVEKDPVKMKQLREQLIVNLKKLLAIHPGDYSVQSELGDVYYHNVQYDSAEAHEKIALLQNPANTYALNILGEIYTDCKKYTEAIEPLKKAAELLPTDVNIQVRLGSAYLRVSQYDSAEAHYKQALLQSPQNADAKNNLGGVYFFTKKYPKAIELYKEAIDIKPDYVNTYANIGQCYQNTGKLDSAVYYLNKAIRIDPSFKISYSVLASVYKIMGESDSARKYELLTQTK